MKIGVVMHPYGEKRPSGLGRTTPEITRALIESDKSDNEYTVFVKGKQKTLPRFDGRCSIVEGYDGLLWLDRTLYAQNDLDVVFFITPFVPWLVRPKNTVVMVHDLVHFQKRRFGIRAFLVRFMHRMAIKRATVAVAISPATREDMINLLNVTNEKIQVVRQGYTRVCQIEEMPVENLKTPFFLSVGVVKQRKNTLRVVEAFGLFKSQNPNSDHSLVIAGSYAKDDYYKEIQDVINRYDIKESVIFTNFISDNQLSYLYKRATTLVFTTLMEGFGAPILEAMNCGLPVITSDLPVHRQTAGQAAYFADPTNAEEIAVQMNKVVFNTIERDEKIETGKKHAEDSSWEQAASEYHRIFSDIKK